jgi:homoserine dehydrogenase
MSYRSLRPVVLKFGGSILRDEAALHAVASEIRRHVRSRVPVVAVVSAQYGETDALLRRGRRLAGSDSARHLASLVATGEAMSAALLGITLERSGIGCSVVDARLAGLTVRGPALDADPHALDCDAFERLLSERPVAVLPGFVGCTPEGDLALLGRGGSDLTALFVARVLGATKCHLIKDVDGVYECDPAVPGSRGRRYTTITWHDASALGGAVLQPKALRFAEEARLSFEVRALGSSHATRVGPGPTRFARRRSDRTEEAPLQAAG